MRILYYSSTPFMTPHFGVLLNQAMEDTKNGDEVYWAYCKGILPLCPMNPTGNRNYCRFCGLAYSQVKRYYGRGMKFIPLTAEKPESSLKERYNFESISDIKGISYRGAKLGYSILSYYFSCTRNLESDISDEFKEYIYALLGPLEKLVDRAYKIVDDYGIEKVKIFNGRFFHNRVFYDVSEVLKVQFSSLEVVGGYNEKFYPVEYEGGLPHNIDNFTQSVNYVWESCEDESKEKIGASFYENRRNGVSAGDKVYVGAQSSGLLPDGYDPEKVNIVFFNSSADEIAALGGEWEESTRLFTSQKDAIDYIVSNSPKDYQFYLRIHPNLANVKYSYHTGLYELAEKHSNLVVIEPKSPVSSYSLLDIADKVIVFGSTMGVEACYWGKPVILVGASFYAGLDVCYKPKEKADIIDLVKTENLAPKDRLNAIKYAFFLMDRKYRVSKVNNIDINVGCWNFLWKKKIIDLRYLKFLGSNKLFSLIFRFALYHCFRSGPYKRVSELK